MRSSIYSSLCVCFWISASGLHLHPETDPAATAASQRSITRFETGTRICFGKGGCLDPNKFEDAALSALWGLYKRSSTSRALKYASPFAKCCESCSKTAKCSNSRNEEHIFLSHIHPFKKNNSAQGVFLEVGGNDGVQASNTIFLERCLEWRGLMLEGHPGYFERMMINRPGVVGISTALCEEQQNVSFSDNPSVTSHVQQRGIQVPCNRLDQILRALTVDHIDFFSLDVEGAEVHVLKSINWSKLAIGVLVVEELQSPAGAQKNEQARAIIQGQGNMKHLFSHCWSTFACDAYFASPKWVDIDAVGKHLENTPLPSGSQKIRGKGCKA